MDPVRTGAQLNVMHLPLQEQMGHKERYDIRWSKDAKNVLKIKREAHCPCESGSVITNGEKRMLLV